MNELQYMKDMITDKLNERIGREVVKNIFFVTGRQEPPKPAPAAQPVEIAAPPAPDQDEAQLASIRDPAVRDTFKRLLETSTRKGRQ
jgi:hypothetical protein